MPGDPGPPYIVKLTQLPVSCNSLFVEDLFQSRYTPYVKFKILADPTTDPLRTGNLRKIAFVELESYQDYSKAVKWHDLYYRQGRRVVIEMADFRDFQDSVRFNQEHQGSLEDLEREVASGNFRPHAPASNLGPKLGSHAGAGSGAETSKPGFDTVLSKPKPKPSPFGAAKPVDVMAKEGEIQKKLVTVNHTTIKTVGSVDAPKERRKSVNILRRDTKPEPVVVTSPSSAPGQPVPPDDAKSATTYSPAPIASVYGDGKNISLAQLLSSANNEQNLTSNNSKSSPKPAASKPIILKKKAVTAPIIAPKLVESESEAVEKVEPRAVETTPPRTTEPVANIAKPPRRETTNERKPVEPTPRTPNEPLFKKTEHPNSQDATSQQKDRPDFKHMFKELTQKYVPKERNNKPRGRYREADTNVSEHEERVASNASPNKHTGRRNSREASNSTRKTPRLPRAPRRRDKPENEEEPGPPRIPSNEPAVSKAKFERSKDTKRSEKAHTERQKFERNSKPDGSREATEGSLESHRAKSADSFSADRNEHSPLKPQGSTTKHDRAEGGKSKGRRERREKATANQSPEKLDGANDESTGEHTNSERGNHSGRSRGGHRRRGRGNVNLHYVRLKQLDLDKSMISEAVQ